MKLLKSLSSNLSRKHTHARTRSRARFFPSILLKDFPPNKLFPSFPRAINRTSNHPPSLFSFDPNTKPTPHNHKTPRVFGRGCSFFSPMSRPRRPLSVLLLLLPSSLVALSFLIFLLACNGLGLGLFCPDDYLPLTPLRDPVPKTSSLLVLSEETPISIPKVLQSSHLLPDDGPLSAPFDPTPKTVSLHEEDISLLKLETVRSSGSHLLPDRGLPSTPPPRDPIPSLSSLPALREETPLPNPEFLQSSRLLPDSSDGHHLPTQPDFSLPSRKPKWSKRSRRFLHPSARSSRFYARVAEFLHEHRSNAAHSPCKHCFFMTWISPLEAFGPRQLFSIVIGQTGHAWHGPPPHGPRVVPSLDFRLSGLCQAWPV